MRILAALTALLLMLAPVSLADEGEDGETESSSSSSGSSTSSSSTSTTGPEPEDNETEDDHEGEASNETEDADDRYRACMDSAATYDDEEACKMAFCDEDPDDRRCRTGASRGPGSAIQQWCRDPARNETERANCDQLSSQGHQDGSRWVHFELDRNDTALLGITVGGLLAIERADLVAAGDEVEIGMHGNRLELRDGSSVLQLYDIPTGLLRFKGVDPAAVEVTFPAEAIIVETEHGASVRYEASGLAREAVLVAANATWLDARTVLLSGFFSFHIAPLGETAPGPERQEAREEVKEAVRSAVGERQVAAEVVLRAGSDAADATTLASSNDTIQILAYDDVEVEVTALPALATNETPIRVEVSSHLEAGRTIVLNIDPELLASDDPDDLILRYYDVHEDGTETEVIFRQASSLEDILDAADDGGQPEYWIVTDENGVEVLASIPHWSTHAITVASLSSTLGSPSVVVGIVSGVAGSVMLAVVLFWPRRRDEV